MGIGLNMHWSKWTVQMSNWYSSILHIVVMDSKGPITMDWYALGSDVYTDKVSDTLNYEINMKL